MSEPFIGEIRACPYNFAPRGFAYCDGSLLEVAQHAALFSVISAAFGGDGRVNFGLPRLNEGRLALSMGQGPGLSGRTLGHLGGETEHLLTEDQMAGHSHTMTGNNGAGDSAEAVNALYASNRAKSYTTDTSQLQAMSTGAVTPVGGDQDHSNLMPTQTLSYIIALEGVYPSRS